MIFGTYKLHNADNEMMLSLLYYVNSYSLDGATNMSTFYLHLCIMSVLLSLNFYPRDAMLARVIEIATCLSVCPSVRPTRAGIVSKRRKLAA